MNIINYAYSFIGTRYTWGGDSADEGYDCSGLIQELIRSQYKYLGDRTAQGLYWKIRELFRCDVVNDIDDIEPQDILFYGRSLSEIGHISMAVSTTQVIEAGGEGSISTTKGMVRVRHVDNRRNDFVGGLRLYGLK